jgi:5'-nucleotidase / UDP-sugar diphosphatase
MHKTALYLMAILLAGSLSSAFAADQLSTAGCDKQEVSFGDLTADALCANSGATMAFVPALSFKSGSVPAVGATQAQVASLLQVPEESWAVCSLTGAQIRQSLERSLNRLPLPSVAFLQLSGLTVTYDASKPRDHRVVSVRSPKGPVLAEQKYEVVMPLSLAQGASGYFLIFDKDSIVRQGTTGLGALIYAFLQANPDREYTGQGRLVPTTG